MLRTIAAVLLICSRAWAITPGQFWREIIDHRSRLKEEMLMVFDKNPARFAEVDRLTVSEYALLHDTAKVQPRFFSQLIRFHGVNKKFLNPAAKARLEDLTVQINATEAVEKNKFFSTVTPEAESELLELEHIAEVVDTGVFSPAELGNTLGSKILRFVESAEPEVVEIAEDLEAVLLVVK